MNSERNRIELTSVLMRADCVGGYDAIKPFTEYGILKAKISNVLSVMVDIEAENGFGRDKNYARLFSLLNDRRKTLNNKLADIGLEKRK